jgi:glycine/D-amino acid oxidase-like deaminating enzyme
MASRRPKIIVVGAGIVGASIAYHLSRRGAAVTVVDKGPPAGGVTGAAFAWINNSQETSTPASPLRRHAIAEWRRLERELAPALRINWCGALTWREDPAATERWARGRAACGYEVRLIEREEIAKLEPGLIEPPACAAYAPGEGAVDPIAATDSLVHRARQLGADIRLGTEVTALASKGGKIVGVRAGEERIDADIVVVAAGVNSPALCASLGVAAPIDASAALLLRFRTARRLVDTVLSTPDMEVRQASEHLLLAAENHIADAGDNGPESIARRTLAVIRRQLRGAEGTELDSVSVGLRPIPADGSPVVGFTPSAGGLYLAVMHAGVTLAAAVGRLAAREILDGANASELQPCRIERFAPYSPSSVQPAAPGGRNA